MSSGEAGERRTRGCWEGRTHVCVVERVSELDSVAGCGLEVDLVLCDELGAVEVVLLRNEGLGSNEDVRVRVGDPDDNLSRLSPTH